MEIRSSKQLYNKLLFTYTAVIVSVVLALTTYFIYSMKNRYLERNLDDIQRMCSEAERFMESSEAAADSMHEELYKSSIELNDLIHYLKESPEDYWKYRLDAYIEYGFQDYKGMSDFVSSSFATYSSLKQISVISYINGDMTVYVEDKKMSRSQDRRSVLRRVQNNDLADPGEFSFLKEIRDPATMQSMGTMIITFDASRFERIWEAYSNAEFMVYNDCGTVVYDSGEEHDYAMIEQARQNNRLDEYLEAHTQEVRFENYLIVGYVLNSKAAQIPISLFLISIGMAALVIFVGELLVTFYLRRLSMRLNHILDGMKSVMSGNLDTRLDADRNGDELDLISEHFNEMCRKLDLHIKKSYLAEIEQKNAEMAALQSQINPHFLYNTLEAIRMKAICNGDREVGKMLYSMAVTFRSQLKEADVITLAQELDYTKKYLQLFEFRYQNQFHTEVDCPIEFMQVPIIKFVLQPIIENYFIHGIRMGEADNLITIKVRERFEECWIIVEDNGRGMTAEELEAKNAQLSANQMDKRKSIGLANVNRRIKAVYGEDYGIHMEAREEGGLRVILRFDPEEGGTDEEGNDS